MLGFRLEILNLRKLSGKEPGGLCLCYTCPGQQKWLGAQQLWPAEGPVWVAGEAVVTQLLTRSLTLGWGRNSQGKSEEMCGLS